jgi:hypothetical protein
LSLTLITQDYLTRSDISIFPARVDMVTSFQEEELSKKEGKK